MSDDDDPHFGTTWREACEAIPQLRIAARGFWIVLLTASNVAQIAGGHYGGALVGGFLISLTWWSNSHAAKVHVRWGAVAYGIGAALGTVSGMWLTRWFYG